MRIATKCIYVLRNLFVFVFTTQTFRGRQQIISSQLAVLHENVRKLTEETTEGSCSLTISEDIVRNPDAQLFFFFFSGKSSAGSVLSASSTFSS